MPGVEDAEIEALQGAALKYAGIRDKRMKLTVSEGELKAELLALTKKHRKKVYEYNGVRVEVVVEEETVKVRIAKEKEDKDGEEQD